MILPLLWVSHIGQQRHTKIIKQVKASLYCTLAWTGDPLTGYFLWLKADFALSTIASPTWTAVEMACSFSSILRWIRWILCLMISTATITTIINTNMIAM